MPGHVTTGSSGNEAFKENSFRRRLVPNVIRVQDPSRVPAQGTRIVPGDYVGRSIIPGIAPANPSAALDVATGNAGVTVREIFSDVRLRIYPADATVGARFAYEIVSPRQKREARGTTEIRALVARDTRVEITEPRPAPPFGKDEIDIFGDHNVRLHIYQARDPQKIPPQGTRLDDALLERLGTERAPDRRYRPPTTGQAVALAATDAGMSMVPGAGDVYDLVQFGKSALTGTDVQGRPVSDGELAIMGVAVLLPFLGAGVVRTAARTTRTVDALAGQFGRTADEIEVLLVQLDGLEPADQEVVRRIERMLEQGKRVDPDDIEHVLGKLEALGFGNVQLRGMDGMMGEPAAARSPWASLGEAPEVDAMHIAGKKPPRPRDPFVAVDRDSAARVAFEQLEKTSALTARCAWPWPRPRATPRRSSIRRHTSRQSTRLGRTISNSSRATRTQAGRASCARRMRHRRGFPGASTPKASTQPGPTSMPMPASAARPPRSSRTSEAEILATARRLRKAMNIK